MTLRTRYSLIKNMYLTSSFPPVACFQILYSFKLSRLIYEAKSKNNNKNVYLADDIRWSCYLCKPLVAQIQHCDLLSTLKTSHRNIKSSNILLLHTRSHSCQNQITFHKAYSRQVKVRTLFFWGDDPRLRKLIQFQSLRTQIMENSDPKTKQLQSLRMQELTLEPVQTVEMNK